MILGGLVSITFRKLTPEQIVDLVRQAGLSGIEWGGDVHVPHGDLEGARHVRQITADAGLQVAAYGSYYRAGVSEAEGLAFEKVLATARDLGAPLVRVWPYMKGSAQTTDDERASVVADLQRIGSMAAEAGVGISCEFHGNTLTDTDASAQQLLREVAHPNVKLYWQPHNGQAFEQCLNGLHATRSSVTNAHVFHWTYCGDQRTMHPLEDGAERWVPYLRALTEGPGNRFALIEFVRGDEPQQFLDDARTLAGWLDRIHAAV